jgi:hypothetical protein
MMHGKKNIKKSQQQSYSASPDSTVTSLVAFGAC